MKSIKTILSCLLVITSLLAGGSLLAMEEGSEREKPYWYEQALNAKISSPLRIRTVNNTGALVKTVQQGQSKDYWFANIPAGNKFEDTLFNMDPWTKESPQYFFITDKNLYTLNFEKEKDEFKAIFEKLALKLKSGAINTITFPALANFVQLVETDPAAKIEFQPIEPGDTLIIKLDKDSANLELTY